MKVIKIIVFLLMLGGTVTTNATISAYDLVKETSNRMIAALKDKSSDLDQNPKLIYDLVDEIILPHFDFERMSQLVLGKYWNRVGADEKEQFVNEFRTLLVRTYASAMSEYSDEEIVFLPFHSDDKADDVTVKTEVDQKSGFPIPIDYSLHMRQGEWKVYDVSIDDVSLVVNYRTSFASEIKQSGVAELIKKLKERNRQALNPGGE